MEVQRTAWLTVDGCEEIARQTVESFERLAAEPGDDGHYRAMAAGARAVLHKLAAARRGRVVPYETQGLRSALRDLVKVYEAAGKKTPEMILQFGKWLAENES